MRLIANDINVFQRESCPDAQRCRPQHRQRCALPGPFRRNPTIGIHHINDFVAQPREISLVVVVLEHNLPELALSIRLQQPAQRLIILLPHLPNVFFPQALFFRREKEQSPGIAAGTIRVVRKRVAAEMPL